MLKRGTIALSILSLSTLLLFADPKIPNITYLYPQGAQRGLSPEVTIGGQFLQETSKVLVAGQGISATIEKSAPNSVTAKFSVAGNVEPGTYEVRVLTPLGMSNTLLFTVGTLNEIMESEPNNEIAKANPVTPPVTINGKIDPGEDQDYFLIHAQAGERLLFDLDATRSGSPLDASLALLDKYGHELAFNEDYYTWDPFLDCTFRKAGDYLVRVRGVGGRGSADSTYRLSIHRQPYLSYIFPLGGRRGTSVEATLGGRLLPQNTEIALHTSFATSETIQNPKSKIQNPHVRLKLKANAPLGDQEIRLQNGPYLSNAVHFDVSDFPEILESEPNDQAQQANPITVPVMINGQLDHPKDVDHFKFSAKKGERLYFEVRAHRLGSPVDAVLTLLDSKGRELANNDDPVAPSFNEPANWDAKLAYLFQADGEYVIQIRDVTGQGGEGFPYRLLIRPAKPTFTLKFTPENPAVEQGKTEKVAVSLVREEGFAGEVELSFLNLPEGVHTSGPLKIGEKENKTTVELEADNGTRPGLVPIKVVGRARFENVTIEKEALGVIKLPRVSGQDVLRMAHHITLSVTEPPPFALEVKPEKLSLKLGQTARMKVKATRRPGFAKPIQISTAGLPKGIRIQPVDLMPNEDEKELVIEATPEAAKGNTPAVVLTGTAEVTGRKLSEQAPAIRLNVQ